MINTEIIAKRRFTDHKKPGKRIINLAVDHPALIEGRSIFPTRVGAGSDRLLKSGEHSRKIGSHVTKGKWAGMPIFTLTLEERKTCPSSCVHWSNCYGNHMHFAPRQIHGDDFEVRLERELSALNRQYPDGFVIRLHVLGDFYSARYVMQWATWLGKFRALHVFGYTARDPENDVIGKCLEAVRAIEPERWWVRWSHRDKQTWLSTGDSGIVCPAQTEKTSCCGTCALCWSAQKPIKFLEH